MNSQSSSTQSVFKKFAQTRSLFKKLDDHHYRMIVHWPHRNGYKDITIQSELPKKEDKKHTIGSLHFYDNEEFLTCNINTNNKLTIIEPKLSQKQSQEWNTVEKEELIDHFNNAILPSNSNHDEKKISTVNTLEKETLDKLIKQYGDYNINYKINNVIIKNATALKNNYIFRINWPDSNKQNHLLEARFTRSMPLNRSNTHFMNEKSFLTSFQEYNTYQMNTGQYYYSVTLSETCIDPESKQDLIAPKPVLKFWMTSDAQYGELADVSKGKLSGNDLLNIYNYFDSFFKIKNTFICDASLLNHDDKSSPIFLRALLPIVTGKTWYESKLPNLSLFESKTINSIYFGEMKQNASARAKALKEVQELTLVKWSAMLDKDQNKILMDLYCNHIKPKAKRRSTKKKSVQKLDNKTTLQMLTTSIYNDAKNKKQITQDLLNLTKLLYADIPKNYHIKPDDKSADYWLKSRMYILLWGSYYWIKQRDEKENTASTKLSS